MKLPKSTVSLLWNAVSLDNLLSPILRLATFFTWLLWGRCASAAMAANTTCAAATCSGTTRMNLSKDFAHWHLGDSIPWSFMLPPCLHQIFRKGCQGWMCGRPGRCFQIFMRLGRTTPTGNLAAPSAAMRLFPGFCSVVILRTCPRREPGRKTGWANSGGILKIRCGKISGGRTRSIVSRPWRGPAPQPFTAPVCQPSEYRRCAGSKLSAWKWHEVSSSILNCRSQKLRKRQVMKG